MKKDTVLASSKKRWHKSLSKDLYVEEAINVLSELKPIYQKRKKKK
jgi:carboxyl-terminal processing protease